MSDLSPQNVSALAEAASQILQILDGEETGNHQPFYATETPGDGQLAAVARSILRKRRLRAKHLPIELFSEPAWDILLDLYVSDFERKDLTVTAACLASASPATTALRWLDALVKLGLVERYPASTDKRMIFVRISDEGRNAIRGYLTACLERARLRTPGLSARGEEGNLLRVG